MAELDENKTVESGDRELLSVFDSEKDRHCYDLLELSDFFSVLIQNEKEAIKDDYAWEDCDDFNAFKIKKSGQICTTDEEHCHSTLYLGRGWGIAPAPFLISLLAARTPFYTYILFFYAQRTACWLQSSSCSQYMSLVIREF